MQIGAPGQPGLIQQQVLQSWQILCHKSRHFGDELGNVGGGRPAPRLGTEQLSYRAFRDIACVLPEQIAPLPVHCL